MHRLRAYACAVHRVFVQGDRPSRRRGGGQIDAALRARQAVFGFQAECARRGCETVRDSRSRRVVQICRRGARRGDLFRPCGEVGVFAHAVQGGEGAYVRARTLRRDRGRQAHRRRQIRRHTRLCRIRQGMHRLRAGGSGLFDVRAVQRRGHIRRADTACSDRRERHLRP